MNITDVFPLCSQMMEVEFERRKQNIRESHFPGTGKLLRDFNRVTEREGFLNRLCEINIANRLIERGKRFEYEVRGEDFAYDDILMSVKSLQPKAYEREEKVLLAQLREQAISGNCSREGKIDRKNPFASSIVAIEATPGGYSRSETGILTNALLPTDAYEEKIICQYAAEFEALNAMSYKKVMFFMRQSERVLPYHVEDVARWYYGQPSLGNVDSSFYEKVFKKRGDKTPLEKKGTISAFVFMQHTEPILWSKDFGNASVNIWTEDRELEIHLQKIFQ